MTVSKFILSDTLSADGSSGDEESWIINFPKLMSSINRKQYHNVDMQGNAQLYTIAINTFGKNTYSIARAAAEGYCTKRAVKAWHEARKIMFKRAGFNLRDLNSYARTLRPYLSPSHQNGTIPEFDTAIGGNNISTGDGGTGVITPGFKGAEWTYSKAVHVPGAEEGHTTTVLERDLVDDYVFTLTGESVNASSENNTSENYVSVGMIAEWLDSFRKQIPMRTVDADTAIDADNALLQLMSHQSTDKEELLEVVEDINAENRPWDKTGAQYYTELPVLFDRSVHGQSSTSVIRVPCGLLEFSLSNLDSSSDTVFTTFDVLSIEDM